MSHTFTLAEIKRSHEAVRANRAAKIAQEFWAWMDRSGGPDACWEWTRGRQTPQPGRIGYGVFSERNRDVYAHRRALELSLGRKLSRGEHALHRCDNPPCCNPNHLFVGTPGDNMQDMARKGHSRARLTHDQVRAIRRAIAGGRPMAAIARDYGLSPTPVHLIKYGRTYRYVEDVT